MGVVMIYKLSAVLCVFLFCALLFASDEDLEYTNVNVRLETEWADPEEVQNVDVVVLALSDGSKQIVLFRKYEKIMEITVIDGVKVKIFDADNGKLLKTYSKEPISAVE